MRPDGRISVPLLEDVQAADKTPTELAREIEQQLSAFVADPLVTAIDSWVRPPNRSGWWGKRPSRRRSPIAAT